MGELGKSRHAAELYRESKEAFAESLGMQHPAYAACLTNLARVEREAGDPPQAEALLKEAMAVYSSDLSSTHAEYRQTLRSLASLYEATQRRELVQPLLLEEKRVEGIAART